MPIQLNSINFDTKDFIYSLVDASGNVYIDHAHLVITTELTLVDLINTARADATSKKAAVQGVFQARATTMQNQATVLGGAGLP